MKQFCRLVKTHTFLTCLVLAAVLLASIIIGIGTGPVAIPFAEVWRVMFHRLGGLLTGSELPLEGVRESTQNIVWFLRAPRVLLGALVGAALTLSGVGMQAFTKNPLAEPYVLGISSGASLGAVLAMLLGVSLPVLGRLSVSAGAFAGALVSILLVYLLARTRNAVTPIRLILVGVAVSAMFQAFTNYIVYTAPDDAAVREATFWMLGGLGSAEWADVPLLAGLVPPALLLMLALAKPLNAMMMGDSSAGLLGGGQRLHRLCGAGHPPPGSLGGGAGSPEAGSPGHSVRGHLSHLGRRGSPDHQAAGGDPRGNPDGVPGRTPVPVDDQGAPL